MSGADLLVVAGFVALFAVGFVVGARTGARSLVRQALSAPAPEVRRAAVRLAVHTGLARHVKALMQRTRVEEDRRVLATLADVVSAAAPTPDDPPLLDELRLWARSYPDTQPLPGSGGDRARDLSWVLPVALCNVAAVAGAVVGAGLGGGGLAVAGSAIFAGGVLVVYALRATPGARSGGGERGWWVGAARRPRPVPEPPHPREPSALDTLNTAAPPPPTDDVIDLRTAGRGRVEAPTGRERSAAEAFWDVTAPDDEVKEVLDRREGSPGGRRPARRRRLGPGQ